STALNKYGFFMLLQYLLVQRFAPRFVDPREAAFLKRKSKRVYYRFLAKQVLRLRERAFWQYHNGGIETLHEKLDVSYLTLLIVKELLWMACNPGLTTVEALSSWKRRRMGKKASPSATVPCRTPDLSAKPTA